MTEAPTLQERLALAQISSHLGSAQDERQTPVDRITALGFAPRLGSLLIRLKGANDRQSYIDALDLISTRMFQLAQKHRWGHMERCRRVSNEALRFYIFDMCTTCGGRGVLAHSYSGPADDDAGAVCPGCGGSAKAHRNVQERAGSIFKLGDIPNRLEKMLNEADAIIGRAERIATGISRWKLYGHDNA